MDIFFKENQRLLLDIVNTEAGNILISKLGQKPQNKIIYISQNSFIELIGFERENAILRGTYFSRYPLLKIFAPIVEKIQRLAFSKYLDIYLENKYDAFLHYSGLQHNSKFPHIFLTTSTFSPSAGSVSPVDGYVGRDAVNESWATIIAGAGTASNAAATAANNTPNTIASATTNQFQANYRNIWCFDTSSLTSAAIISSASIALFAPATAKGNVIGSPDFHIAGATPASTSALANSDYGNVQKTSFSNIVYASYASGTNTFTLNSSGISNISLTGVSKFSGQLSWDVNSSFTGTWSSNGQSFFSANMADDGSNIPVLSVIFSISKGGNLLLMGMG